jgi:hypothetical protein
MRGTARTTTLAAGSATPLWRYEIVVEAPEAQARPVMTKAFNSAPARYETTARLRMGHCRERSLRALRLSAVHHLADAVQDVRDGLVLGQEVVLDLLGFLQHRFGVLVGVLGPLIG